MLSKSMGKVHEGMSPNSKYKVNKEICRACKMCLRSRCPAIKVTDKAEIQIDKCNGCAICLTLCPTGAIEKIE